MSRFPGQPRDHAMGSHLQPNFLQTIDHIAHAATDRLAGPAVHYNH
jgi:hypothetical protein